MKKLVLFLLLGLNGVVFAQDARVEKSRSGLQTGLLGVWFHNESRISSSVALRSEVGLHAGIWGGDFYDKTGFVLSPVLTLEPRFYYNLNKRVSQSKNIKGNSGNFLSLELSYLPSGMEITNDKSVSVMSSFLAVPTWGIRRQVGKHFVYEAGTGFGLRKQLEGNEETESYFKLHFRVGYNF